MTTNLTNPTPTTTPTTTPTATRARRLRAVLGLGATLLTGAAGLLPTAAGAQPQPEPGGGAVICIVNVDCPTPGGDGNTNGHGVDNDLANPELPPDVIPPDGDPDGDGDGDDFTPTDLGDLTPNPDDPDGDDGPDGDDHNPDLVDEGGTDEGGHVRTPRRIDTGAGGSTGGASAIPGLAVLGGGVLGLGALATYGAVRKARASSEESR